MKIVFEINTLEKISLRGQKCAHNSPSLGLGHMNLAHIHKSYLFKIHNNIIPCCTYFCTRGRK